QASLFDRMFPAEGATALQLWLFLRRESAQDPRRTMRLLRELMGGQIKGKELQDLLGSAPRGQDPGTALWRSCVHAIFLKAGMEESANEYLAQSAVDARQRPHLRYGDFLAGQKRWELAAAQYGRAWDLNRTEPLPLYLKGWALVQAGQAQEGKR